MVRIGETAVPLREPLAPELVPRPSATRGTAWVDSPDALEALQWLMKKQQLGQDVFLLGAPGPHLRQLAFRFCSGSLVGCLTDLAAIDVAGEGFRLPPSAQRRFVMAGQAHSAERRHHSSANVSS